MGYRSDVAFVIEFDTVKNAQIYFDKVNIPLIAWANLKQRGCYITFHETSIKWYTDSDYDDVNHLQSVYVNSPEADGYVGYLFKRFGESNDDYEIDENGDVPWDAINEVRMLELNIGELG